LASLAGIEVPEGDFEFVVTIRRGNQVPSAGEASVVRERNLEIDMGHNSRTDIVDHQGIFHERFAASIDPRGSDLVSDLDTTTRAIWGT